MAEQLKQIREFTTLPDFGDNDLLLAQSAGTTYNVKGRALKAYAIAAAKAQADAAQAAKEAALAAQAAAEADRIAAESAASGAGVAETGAEEAKAVAEQARAAAQSAQAAADAAKAAAEAAAAQAESVILGKIPDGSLEEAKLTASAVAKLNGNHLHGMAQIDGLDESLSDKAARLDCGEIPPGVGIDDWFVIGTVAVASTSPGYPPDWTAGSWAMLTTQASGSGGYTQCLSLAVNQGYYTEQRHRTYNNGWGKWTPFATATPQQEYGLPLAAGYMAFPGYGVRYSKNQFGEVTVHLAIKRVDGTQIPNGAVVAILPEGYRPTIKIVAAPEVTLQSGGRNGGALMQITLAGEIVVYSSESIVDVGAGFHFVASSAS